MLDHENLRETKQCFDIPDFMHELSGGNHMFLWSIIVPV